jgi:hypothetical protein
MTMPSDFGNLLHNADKTVTNNAHELSLAGRMEAMDNLKLRLEAMSAVPASMQIPERLAAAQRVFLEPWGAATAPKAAKLTQDKNLGQTKKADAATTGPARLKKGRPVTFKPNGLAPP